MRLPNGYGSVYKLSGNRRKPWVARATIGWDIDDNMNKVTQKYAYIGYYKSQKEALSALANYNENPFDLSNKASTFAEVYDKWSDIHFEKIKDSTGYKAAYKICEPIHNMKFAELNLNHFQNIVDNSGKNTPTLRNLKNLINLMYDYAIVRDIVSKEKKDKVKYLDISKPGNPKALNRTKFKDNEVDRIWDVKDDNIYYTVVLMMLYCGVRINELLSLEKKNVHLEQRWFFVADAKTEAGIRVVPIFKK
ncbi:tyrosine-type recombinase/integrase [Peptostreptococcus equinus]|uniref:Site-specific integrase n=1 Tax=Peptostreptococcus equinus TaxID=3003601 RepID=A0ABY7JS16_9FIRM|nr:site-specific integrase [Peptostreptococcus sp. CBA3647]WAW14775.1 site-specific integrase [Peptostreptococcus sp. CBA3647]